MSYITTRDDVRLYVKDWGTGRPVVLMHGWPLNADTFDELSMAIADAGMRAISYDRRGFGRSDQPWTGYDYDTLSDDLAAVIEQTGATDATLLGFSMGGGEVARYLSRHGGRGVRQAVLVSSILPYLLKTDDNPDGVDGSVFQGMTDEMTKDRAAFWPTFAKQFYGVSLISHPVSQEVVDWSCALAMQAGYKPTLACAQAFATTDFRADMASFTMPTLVIHGTDDKTVPIDASARRVAKHLPHAQYVEIDGGPHGLLASHKDEVISTVLTFLRG